MALVRGVTLRAASSRSRLKQTGQASTKTGVAPTRATQPAVAKKVNVGTNTSSPGPIPNAINASRIASVPEETPSACRAPVSASSSRSKASTSGPRMNCPLRKTRRKASVSSASSGWFWALTSSSGTGMGLEGWLQDGFLIWPR